MTLEQKSLASEQTRAFYHDEFVTDQVRDFRELVPVPTDARTLLDIGGGCGFFADAVQRSLGRKVKVLDADPVSVERCADLGVDAELGDALNPAADPEVDVVSFNLILHHLVGKDAQTTRVLQTQALQKWNGRNVRLFVNEYIYQSYLGYVSGRAIYAITSSKLLSAIAGLVARVVPAFRANTFGVGVRFRAHEEWIELFKSAGFKVVDSRIGEPEPVKLPLRLLLIKDIRRDSFLLEDAN